MLLQKSVPSFIVKSMTTFRSDPRGLIFHLLTKVKRFHKTHQFLKKTTPFTMKIDSPQFQSIFTPETKTLIEIFMKHGHELKIAGGAVRDILLCKVPEDVDFATTATPDTMKKMFETENVRMINTKGESHGTITARINDKMNYEVTTLRIDVLTDGRQAKVQFTKDWLLDAERRDLTINAMFLGTDGTLYDYFNGYHDLQLRKIAFVGNARVRIQEDYLRIMRYFRFFGRISINGSKHDIDTLESIKENAKGLERVSGERLWIELKKILEGNFVDQLVEVMADAGILPHLSFSYKVNMDELKMVYNRSQHLKFHPITLIVTLFRTSDDMLEFRERMKISNFERDLGLFILQHRESNKENTDFYKSLVVRMPGRVGRAKQFVMELLKYIHNEAALREIEDWKVPKFPLDGRKLVEKGVKQKQVFKRIMDEIKNRWIESDYALSENELLDCLPEVLESIDSENISK